MLEVRCDPAAVDLRRLAVDGGTLVARWTPPRGARPRRGEAVMLNDERVSVLAVLARRHVLRRRWSFVVRPLHPTTGNRPAHR